MRAALLGAALLFAIPAGGQGPGRAPNAASPGSSPGPVATLHQETIAQPRRGFIRRHPGPFLLVGGALAGWALAKFNNHDSPPCPAAPRCHDRDGDCEGD